MNVLSLFDGMSCGQIVLNRLGFKYDKYFASEIDKHAIKVTQHNYPDTIQLGDVTKVSGHDLPAIDLLIGGSPCQGFSFAGKGLNFEDPRSKLFFEFVRILKECRVKNPKVKFFLENVRMKAEHEVVISRLLGVNPIIINSSLVSAQNRERLYWTNIGLEPSGLFGDLHSIIPQPKDKGILLKDILEDVVDEKYYLSDIALARIKRKIYSNPKVNPQKTGALNTKNNSGQLSVDSGTTLIQVGSLYENNSDAGRVYSESGKARALKGEAGGGGAKMGLYQVGVVNDRGELRESSEKANNIDANFHKGMDNHGQRTMIVVLEDRIRKGGISKGGISKGGISKAACFTAGGNSGGNHSDMDLLVVREVIQLNDSKESGGQQPYQQNRVYDGNGIAPACQAQLSKGSYAFAIGTRIRRLTPVECCRLQTVPDDYFEGSGVSETQMYRMLGNGWTIDVITHILSFYQHTSIR